jgi:hypothetical protein
MKERVKPDVTESYGQRRIQAQLRVLKSQKHLAVGEKTDVHIPLSMILTNIRQLNEKYFIVYILYKLKYF